MPCTESPERRVVWDWSNSSEFAAEVASWDGGDDPAHRRRAREEELEAGLPRRVSKAQVRLAEAILLVSKCQEKGAAEALSSRWMFVVGKKPRRSRA